MWLNKKQLNDSAVREYRQTLKQVTPNYLVIDGLFDETILDKVVDILQQPQHWQTQKHTYAALYVDDKQWQQANDQQRFVQRDVWQRNAINSADLNLKHLESTNIALDFLNYLRSNEFMAVLSEIFTVRLTDKNVADPLINTNYFRLSSNDFVSEHADDSPGREVCMLLYLNKDWSNSAGGELVFSGKRNEPIYISPLYNRCVLFDPASEGSEHWVKSLNNESNHQFRYNVTSWYWSE